jgi:hypothetical protein
MLLASAFGRVEPAVALLASIRSAPLPTTFPVLAGRPFADLAPLPPRTHGGRNAGLFLAAVLLGLPGLIIAVRASPFMQRAAPPPAPQQAWSPVEFTRRAWKIPIVIDIWDAQDGHLVAFSERKPALIVAMSYAALCGAALARLFHAESSTVQVTLIAAGVLGAAGFVLRRMSSRAIRLVDPNGFVPVKVVERGYSLTDPQATVSTGDDLNDLNLKRRRVEGYRLWELADWQGRVALEIWDKADAKARWNKFLGHRDGYVLSLQGKQLGSFLTLRPGMKEARLDMTPIEGLDRHAVFAALLFIERTDPGRWLA